MIDVMGRIWLQGAPFVRAEVKTLEPQKRPPKTPYVPNEDDIIVESMFLDPNTYDNNMEIQNYQDNEMMDQDEIEE
jgi:hypothetical protein